MEFLIGAGCVVLFFILVWTYETKPREENCNGLEIVSETPHIKKIHKKYDASKFTQKHYDFVLECYEDLKRHNSIASPANKKTQQDLADVLNKITGLDKSVTAYARIWGGQVDRETLAVGNQSFTKG